MGNRVVQNIVFCFSFRVIVRVVKQRILGCAGHVVQRKKCVQLLQSGKWGDRYGY